MNNKKTIARVGNFIVTKRNGLGVYKGCFGVLDDEVQAGQHDVPDGE